MLRYMVDNNTDATVNVFSGLLDFHKKGNRILEKKNPFIYPSSNIITAKEGTVLSIFNGGIWRSFLVNVDTDLSAGNLDTGSGFVVGTDYYVYLVDDGSSGLLVLSANASYPAGQTANNSRKIGGFHFGHIRCTNDKFAPVSPNGTVFGADGVGWQQNVITGIVPNSVWDLQNRPLCSPEGMALVGNIWVDIYPSSVAEAITFEGPTNGLYVANGKLQSKYGLVPTTGSEGLNWYNFQELAARSGKRLLSYGEWVRGAYGNPGGQDAADDYGWTKTSNGGRSRVGCQVNGSGVYDPTSVVKRFAISAHNLVDCVGNVYEWVDETSIFDNGSTTGAWNDVLGADKGQIYEYTPNGLHAFICGGYWGNGVHCGGRSVYLNNCPWNVNTTFGSRLACDKLAG
jgi:formylglycine-generating enzyme required for sulfatase activity